MDTITTIINETSISISHETVTNTSHLSKESLFIEAAVSDNNTLSTVNISDLKIQIHWDSSINDNFSTLYISETRVLFIGCGTLSIRIEIDTRKIFNENYISLFYTFEMYENYILETGELECFLYTKEGKLLSSVPVEPPYTVEYKSGKIVFHSEMADTKELHLPN